MVVRLHGDRDHPRTAGFICPKGAQAHDLHHSPDRLHSPMKRRGARGSGDWEPISWDQALDEIADRLQQLAKAHGAETVAYTFGTIRGSDYSIGTRFMNLFGSPNSVGQDKICLGPITLGEFLTYGFGPSSPDLQPGVTRSLVLWGARPSQSARPAWHTMEKVLDAGAKCIVIDPARTEEAGRVDIWLRPRPGTDAALGLALLHEVIAARPDDSDFISRHTVGFEELKERAANYAADRVASITGCAAEDIRAAGKILCEDGPTAFVAGNGLCQTGVRTVQHGRILACLVALTGNLERKGGQALLGPPRDILANGDFMARDALDIAQRAKALGAEHFASIAHYDQIDETVARAWYGKRGIPHWLSTAHEPTLWQAILDGRPYPVKALIIQGHNPVGGSANTGEVREALLGDGLELLVAHDLFLNATSCLADYVLPAAHWLEKPHFSMGAASLAWSGDYVEAGTAVIPPQYEHRSDYDLFKGLGERCGQAEHWPERVEDFYDMMLAPAGMTFAELARNNGPLSGDAARKPASEAAAMPRGEVFGTLSGKIELRSDMLAAWGLDPLPDFRLSGIFARQDEFPLVLVTGGRKIEGFHQSSQQTPAFRRKNPDPVVTLHHDLAASAGIAEGQWIAIETPVGTVRQRAHIDDIYPSKVVHADRWWYPERAGPSSDPFGVAETNINMCTSNSLEDSDPIMGSWLMRGLPCRIVP
nr:molybdopterin-dependent oxidoreductase [Croceicoccus bisphenolivorans]